MGVIVLVLLVIFKICLLFGVNLLFVSWNLKVLFWGIVIVLSIIIISVIIYCIWLVYCSSVDKYLILVLSLLLWFDLVWLGLLLGLSEELLFRGVVLFVLGLDMVVLIVLSVFFGVLYLNGK